MRWRTRGSVTCSWFRAAWSIRSCRRSPARPGSSRWSPRTRAARSTWLTAMPVPAAPSVRRSGSAGRAPATWRPRSPPPRPIRSPVLVMTGEVPVDMEGLGAFQDASQATLDDTAVMTPLTRLSKTVASSRNLNHWFRHALTDHVGAAERAGASVADARRPDRRMRCRITSRSAASSPASQPLSRDAAMAALDMLAIASRKDADRDPGRCRHRARRGGRAACKEVAERWSIPVATTLRAKGVFPEDHELSLGVFGYAGTRHATGGHPRRRPRVPASCSVRASTSATPCTGRVRRTVQGVA